MYVSQQGMSSFVPGAYCNVAPNFGISQPYQPIPNSQQMFKQQQQALRMMASTIG